MLTMLSHYYMYLYIFVYMLILALFRSNCRQPEFSMSSERVTCPRAAEVSQNYTTVVLRHVFR